VALDHGAGEAVQDDPGRFGVGVVEKERFLVEFQRPHPAARPGHAGHLADNACRVRDMLQDGGRPAGIKFLVVVGQFGGVADPQANPRAEAGRPPPRFGNHRLAGVDTRHVSAVRHEARQLGYIPAGAAPDIQGSARSPQRKLLHQGILGFPQPGHGVGRVEKPDQAARIGGCVHGAELCGTGRAVFRDHRRAIFRNHV